MEGVRKLNLYAPLPSIRRVLTKTEQWSEPEKKKTPVFVLQDQSFDHLTEPASVPFVWEQIPGKPKDDMAILIQESGLLETDEDEDLDTVSSNGSFTVICSASGVSEIEKSDGGNVSKENYDLMMSRFLPAAKAMTLFTHQKQQSSSCYNSSEQKLNAQSKEVRQRSQLVVEQEHCAIIQSLYDDLNIDDDEDDESEDEGGVEQRIYTEVTKKGCGFLPRLCVKNSFKFTNPVSLDSRSNRISKNSGKQIRFLSGFISPVPLDSKSNRVLKYSGDQTSLPNWPTRRLSGFISPYPTSCSERLNRRISKSQELYPVRARREILPNYSNSGEIGMFRNSISTPSRRIQRTTFPDSRFLVEEVSRRRNKSGTLLKTSPEYTTGISPPPLPETPSQPWLRRTLIPSVNKRQYGVVLGQVDTNKLDEEILESTKWETIVKTSYVHNDHVRYSQELIHPSRQHNS